MNPVAVFFLILAFGCLAGWVILSAIREQYIFDGLAFLGAMCAVLAISTQLLRKAHR